MNRQFTFPLFCLLVVCIHRAAFAQSSAPVERTSDGILLPIGDGYLTISPRTDDILRVTYSKDKTFAATQKSIMALPRNGPAAHWDFFAESGAITLSTAAVKARIDLATGAISFLNSAGATIA